MVFVSLVASVIQYFTDETCNPQIPEICCVNVLIFTIISDRFMEVFTVIVDGGISHRQFMSSLTDSTNSIYQTWLGKKSACNFYCVKVSVFYKLLK